MYTIALAMALPIALTGVPLFITLLFAPIFFIVFRQMEGRQKLIIAKNIKVLMQIAITIVVLWGAAKLFASSVRGGGADFAVNYYGMFTLLPAIGLLLFLDVFVLFRSYGKKIGSIALIVVVFVGVLKFSVSYWNKYSHDEQWSKYCEEAKDDFNVVGENIVQIQFHNFIASDKYLKNEDGWMSRTKLEYLGEELLKCSLIKEYEAIDKSGPKPYRATLEDGKVVKTRINDNDVIATHKVSSITERVNMVGYGKTWIDQQSISITNINSGKIVAHRLQFIDGFKKGGRSCAQQYYNQISAVDFLQKAIEKSREK